MKTCTKCRVEQDEDAFNRDSSRTDGRQYWCKDCCCAFRRANPDFVRRNNLRKAYGITLEHYDALWDEQDGMCKLCGETCPTGKRLAVDHCHETGRIRGLLCARCNPGLGYFRDSPDLLQRAIKYLENS